VAAVVVVLLAIGSTLLAGPWGSASGPQEWVDRSAWDPPSERGALPPTTLPPIVASSEFDELECVFRGTSTLDPPLPFDVDVPARPHRMGLLEGASFDCGGGGRRASGLVSLSAQFDRLDLFSGLAAGTGEIVWDGVEPARSSTAVEVEVAVPMIVVWTTIIDGPYAGFRGRLVLDRWEQVLDDRGDIVGVRFEPTAATFTPT
jgi:hypothetical protein